MRTHRRRRFGSWRLVLVVGCGGGQPPPAEPGAVSATPAPPVAARREHVVHVGEQTLDDPYSWLRQKDEPEVMRYLEAENGYAAAMMAGSAALVQSLYGEMMARLVENDRSAPYAQGGYEYYYRTEAGKSYRIHFRRKRTEPANAPPSSSVTAPASGDEQLLLDENALAAGAGFFNLGDLEPSPDQERLAYVTDKVGDEHYTLYLKNVGSAPGGGTQLDQPIADVGTSFAWLDDSHLLYTTLDATNRPDKVFRHRLGTPPASDALVFHEPDGAYYLSLERSRSQRYVFLRLESAVTSEVRFLETSKPTGSFQLVSARRPNVEYEVEDHADRFFVLTNDGAQNFKLMVTDARTPDASHWRTVIPHRPSVQITGLDILRDRLVLYEREGGLPQVRVSNVATPLDSRRLEFDEPAYDVVPGDNRDPDTSKLRLEYTSMVTPRSVFDYDLASGTRELVKRREVPGYDPARFEARRIFAPAADGVQVPVSLVFERARAGDGPRPLFLYGYGAYGVIYEPSFDFTALSLLERGFTVAIAHVRGGGELGRQWYEDGKLRHKKNTFTDFISVAEQLIREGYTTPAQLAISGASAGGLLIGAVSNLRPELFRAVIADVPFVDLMNTMLDASLPLTVNEYEEWGNPNVPDDFAYMRSYSPYDNVSARAYPNLLILAGLNDRRVAYWEPAKWTAKLRALKTDDNLLLLRTSLGSGHTGVSGRYEQLKEQAFQYAFVLNRLGLDR
jgi:oligopeptidase B